MSYPIIGVPTRGDISTQYPGRPIQAQNDTYLKAIIEAGGLPVLLPLQLADEQLLYMFERLDGLMFTGGGDIGPGCYNAQPEVDNIDDVQEVRDQFEMRLIQLALTRHKPFLGICRGIQVLNVAQGGTLWQDMRTQLPTATQHHYTYDIETIYLRDPMAHEVIITPGSQYQRVVGKDQHKVNSLHHQSVKAVGEGLQVTGLSEDGVVEVLEAPNHPFAVAVQWHPELLVAQQQEARQLFAAFVEASRAD